MRPLLTACHEVVLFIRIEGQIVQLLVSDAGKRLPSVVHPESLAISVIAVRQNYIYPVVEVTDVLPLRCVDRAFGCTQMGAAYRHVGSHGLPKRVRRL